MSASPARDANTTNNARGAGASARRKRWRPARDAVWALLEDVIAPGAAVSDTLTEVTGLVEKPPVDQAPSNKIISGRYILQPEVMRTLEDQEKGAGGEIQLTDAMARMIGSQPFHAVAFAGRRFDCGSKTGFVEATLALALERDDIGGEVREIADRLLAG